MPRFTAVKVLPSFGRAEVIITKCPFGTRRAPAPNALISNGRFSTRNSSAVRVGSQFGVT